MLTIHDLAIPAEAMRFVAARPGSTTVENDSSGRRAV
jgi:hypothetical protein